MLQYIVNVLNLKTFLVGLVAALFVHWMIQRFKYKLPPGPFALPLFGNMLQFKTDMIHEEIFEWSKKYGPIMTVYLGQKLVVVVNDITSAMEVLVKKGTDFAGRPTAPSVDIFADGGRDIALGQFGPTWMLHRKISSKALRHYMQGNALEQRVHNAVTCIFDEMRKETEPFDPVKYINFIMGNILFGICYGGSYQYDDPELKRIIELDDQLLDVFNGGGPPEDFIPGLQYIWESSQMRRMKEIMKEMMEIFLGKKYWEHVKSFEKDNIRDFADTLILARQEAENDPEEADLDKLTDRHIIQTLSDIFFAGIDTSRLSLRFAILHMVAYPDIQKKVQEEIDRVVGFDELPSLRHRPDLSYTEAVLHESMRLSIVIPTGILHKTICDTSVGGYDVPKNTTVLINYWALHHDSKAWENVNEFIPERFLEKGKLGPKPESWLPFSAGRRVCLGEFVAKPSLHLLFACLMQRFTWRLPEGAKVDLTPDGNSIALIPKPQKLVIEERKPGTK